MKTEAKKRFHRFWLFYGLLVAALIICSILFLSYVRESLRMYEASQPKYFMDGVLNSIRNMSAAELAGKLSFGNIQPSRFDDIENYKLQRAQQILNSTLTWTGGTEVGGSAVYDLCSDGTKAAEIKIHSVGQKVRLGLMSIPTWELVGIVPLSKPSYLYNITFPSSFKVLVNGLELKSDECASETPMKGYEYEAEYVQMPLIVSYHIENLLTEPVITANNNLGVEIPVKITGNDVNIEPAFAASDFPVELQKEVNALDIAETWSKFLTQDLSGPQNGLEQARAHFIRNSDFWKMAYSYATGVDITFVSDHSLNSFSNEAVKDYIRYSDDCFSCVVYFEKNMTLVRSGEKRTDIFYNRLFFVRYDDTDDGIDNPRWLISDIQAVTENTE